MTARAPELVVDADLRLDGPRSTSRLVGRRRRIELRTTTLSGLADIAGLVRRMRAHGLDPASVPLNAQLAEIEVRLRGVRVAEISAARPSNLAARAVGMAGWRLHPIRLLGAVLSRIGAWS